MHKILFRSFNRNYSTEIKKLNLLGLTLPELQQELSTVRNVKPYTALQLWQHIYKQGHVDFTQMTNLSKDLQAELSEKYTIYYGDIKLDKIAKDQTRKFLIGFNRDPRAIVETVIIPEPKRSTLCVSSQIGCSLNCSFCHTGTQKLERSLTAAEGFICTSAMDVNTYQFMYSGWTIHDSGEAIQWLSNKRKTCDFKYGIYGPRWTSL